MHVQITEEHKHSIAPPAIVFMRYGQNGVSSLIHSKWQCVFETQRRFEKIIGCSIYDVLPGVIETTVGVAQP